MKIKEPSLVCIEGIGNAQREIKRFRTGLAEIVFDIFSTGFYLPDKACDELGEKSVERFKGDLKPIWPKSASGCSGSSKTVARLYCRQNELENTIEFLKGFIQKHAVRVSKD